MLEETHCNVSRCEVDAGSCESHMDSNQWIQIHLIIWWPICLTIMAPILAARNSCRKDDDSLLRSFTSGAPYASRTRDRAEAPEQSSGVGIEPPMFCCGAGLIPLDCGLSGLMVIIFIMNSAFLVTFYALLSSDRPCTTGLGECRTISCICGNVYREGYVFMFCSLSLTSLILVQRISSMFHRHRIQHTILKSILIIGSLLLSLTAVFPERYDANGLMGGYAIFYHLHILGVFGSGLLLLGVPYAWFVGHWYTHRTEAHGADRVPLRSVLIRSMYWFGALGNGVSMTILELALADDTTNFCSFIHDENMCNAWPLMPADNCSMMQACLGEVDGNATWCGDFVQPQYLCRWESSSLTRWSQMLVPIEQLQATACMKSTCSLFEYARSVALEFALLLLILCYVSSFGLHDVKRLLGRASASTCLAQITLDPLDAGMACCDSVNRSECH